MDEQAIRQWYVTLNKSALFSWPRLMKSATVFWEPLPKLAEIMFWPIINHFRLRRNNLYYAISTVDNLALFHCSVEVLRQERAGCLDWRWHEYYLAWIKAVFLEISMFEQYDSVNDVFYLFGLRDWFEKDQKTILRKTWNEECQNWIIMFIVLRFLNLNSFQNLIQ